MKYTSFAIARAVVGITVAVALLGALSSGLARLGWQMGSLGNGLMLVHGPLMICGFLGTLICLERAVALASRSPLIYALPVTSAAGAIALLVSHDSLVAKSLITAASLVLTIVSVYLYRLHLERYALVMGLGALAWFIGNLIWLAGMPLFQVVYPWTAFLILTIVGERLELSRVRMLPRRIENQLLYAIALFLAGVAISLFALGAGIRIFSVGAMGMAIWLLRYDITRITIRKEGLTRYIAVCLVAGYCWLLVGGAIGIWYGAMYGGPIYAAFLHAYLLGFVFSMIFGHAPIILPAVTGLRLTYSPLFYLPLVLLHTSLAFRTIVNLWGGQAAQQWAGMLNVVAVLLFLLLTFASVVRSNWLPAGNKTLAPRPGY